jgi:small ligand-binding sensory domain FIST
MVLQLGVLEYESRMAARSFSVAVNAPDTLARALAAVRADVSTPAGGLVFVSGGLTQQVEQVAEVVRAQWRNVPACVVPAAGVISERGEIESASAAAGVLWRGGRTTPFAIGESASASALREALASAVSGRAATVVLFPRSDFASDMLEGVGSAAPGVCVFGAGTVGGAAIAISASGELLRGRAAGIAIHGLAAPLVESSAACRLVTPLRRIDEASGGMVLRVEGTSALEMLSSSMPEIRGATPEGGAKPAQPQPVVFVALADPKADESAPLTMGPQAAPNPATPLASLDRFVVRPVRGIDPARRGVMIGPEAKPGVRLAFAVRDAAAAKAGLESAARGVSQQALGAAPRFALYLSCAGRGQGLYGAPDVEARVLRQRFGDLPIAGMHSAFEIVPWGPGEARLALYTGVLALFRSPS